MNEAAMREAFEAAFQRLPAFMRNEMRIAFTRGWQAAQAHARAEMGAEIARLKGLVYALGEMRCAKCKFKLFRRTLYVKSGAIGPGTNETEPCPNGCGPLWPVTWKEAAWEMGDRLEAMFAELQAARATLAEPQPTGAGEG
jgi:hypothetical protein